VPIYVYRCVKTSGHEEHMFDLIVPMSDQGKPQLCPTHNCSCESVDYSHTSWSWGKECVDWSAGLSSNPHGMSRTKKP